jgi:hypothetical protein
MPRNESGVFSKPANTTATPNTTIQSALFNSVVDDFVADANTARPVSAGGTGATSAADARTALGLSGLVGAVPELSVASALDNIASLQWNYVASANCTTVGGPTGGGDGVVFTGYASAGAKRAQVYYGLDGVHWRRAYTANAWTTWRPDHKGGGTSNGTNGRYDRWKTGLQVCQKNRLVLEQVSTSLCEATWTFHADAPFVNNDYSIGYTLRPTTDDGDPENIAISATPSGAQIGQVGVSKTTTTVTITVTRQAGTTDFDNGDEMYIDLTATGEWF